jgi:ABC-2 type transport system ATP-binding protein
LTKVYRTRGKTTVAVDGLTLSIQAGEFFSLLGVNGAGKTTTIKMLSGLSAPTAGDAMLGGFSVCKQPLAVRQIIQVSPQNTAVALNLTVRENLALMAGLWGKTGKEVRTAAHRMIQQMGLAKVADDRASTLSGGWQRRLSIAMALITDPAILFLDEPTLGLDVLARRELWAVISELKGQMTVVLTTHYLEEAEALSDRLGVMVGGRLRALGTVAELCARTGKETLEDAFIALAAGQGKGENP